MMFEKVIIGNATLYHGDCREVLPTLDDQSVDIIWTDPPYGHNNNNGDLIHRREAALGHLPLGEDFPQGRPILNDGMDDMKSVVDFMLVQAVRILNKNSCCCCCCGGGGPSPTFAWLANRMDEKGMQFFHAVVWDKMGLGMGWRYRRNYEMVMIAHRKGGKLKWETKRKDAITGNVVRIPRIIPSKEDHPTPKPIELVEHFLALHGKPGDVVLDPFMGRSPAGVAAIRAGMSYIGIELDREHFDASCKRIQDAESQGDLFAPDPQENSTKDPEVDLFSFFSGEAV
ncbi:MAG: DNA-methyltransferase [Acidobacteriaceae bacterium]